MARLDTIRALLALDAQNAWKIYELDVKLVFLNDYLKEDIYVEWHEVFKFKGQEEKIYLLKNVFNYDLKQAPRA